MIKAIIFDFDGVLVESVDIKTEAFRELFKDYPNVLEEFVEYHLVNGGVSRFEKIRYFYKTFLKKDITEQMLKTLCQQYSRLVMDQVIAAPWVAGASGLLDRCLNRYRMFVVSGTPEDEMRIIVRKRGIDRYFESVYGSPRGKKELMKLILDQYHLKPEESIFVGDSITDLDSAKANHMRFLARVNNNHAPWTNDGAVIGTFRDLTNIFSLIESLN